MGAKLGSRLSDIERDLGKSRLERRMPDGVYRIGGCREYRKWTLAKGSLEICFDDNHRAVHMSFSASSPVAAYSDVLLLTDTFRTAGQKISASTTRRRTSAEEMVIQTISYSMPGGIEVDFGGSVREDTLTTPQEDWDDSMIVSTVTIAYISRFPFEPLSKKRTDELK